jgi:hypothetical protein
MRAHFLDVDHFARGKEPVPYALWSGGASKAVVLLAPPNADVAAMVPAADVLAFRSLQTAVDLHWSRGFGGARNGFAHRMEVVGTEKEGAQW